MKILHIGALALAVTLAQRAGADDFLFTRTVGALYEFTSSHKDCDLRSPCGKELASLAQQASRYAQNYLNSPESHGSKWGIAAEATISLSGKLDAAVAQSFMGPLSQEQRTELQNALENFEHAASEAGTAHDIH